MRNALEVGKNRRRWAAWAALLVVLAFALAIGAGAFKAGKAPPTSLYQRTLQVAGEYRCPVCADESAAVSDTPASVEIRDQIRSWLKDGWSQQRVRAEMVHDYGSSILEKPPTSGDSVLIWVIPAVVGALALGGLGLAFARWRRTGALTDEGPGAASAVQPVLPMPDAGQPAPARPPGRLSQRLMLVAGVALVFVAGALWLLDRSTSPRAEDQPETGGVTGITSELTQAAALAQKDPVAALVIYEEVLRSDPDQPVALTAEGWIYAQGGYVSDGLSALKKAEDADPSYPPPHLYRGLVLLEQDHQPAAAVTELTWYLDHHPVKAEVKVAREALAEAKAELKHR